MNKPNSQTDIQSRLHRIIGQLQGLERMIGERRECQEIITQLMAARASLEKLGVMILHDESSYCFVGRGDPKKKLKDLEQITSNLFKIA